MLLFSVIDRDEYSYGKQSNNNKINHIMPPTSSYVWAKVRYKVINQPPPLVPVPLPLPPLGSVQTLRISIRN